MTFHNSFPVAILRRIAALFLAATALFCLVLICGPAAQAAAGDISDYEIDGFDYYVEWGDEWDVGADELFANGVATE